MTPRVTVADPNLLTIPYLEPIEATLARIAASPLPVPRTCHLGNNGAYNWGWLSLARNSRLVLFDHTTYGADRVCLPWTVLGDYGRVAAYYDIDGSEVERHRGVHVNAPARAIPPKHRSILNYGINARQGEVPLATHHYATNIELARRFNASVPSYDSREILDNFDLFAGIVETAHGRGTLERLFDRWVHTRGRRVVFTKLESVEGRGDRVVLRGPGGEVLFDGTVAELLAQVDESLGSLRAHVELGRPLAGIGHPWLSLPFAYLFGAATDYARRPDLRVHVHAGGLTSPYYMNDPAFRVRFRAVYDELARTAFLPRGFRFVLVPIGCCQLFATSSPSILGEIVERWRGTVASLPNRRAVLDLLAGQSRPFGPEFRRATRELDSRFLAWLRAAVLRFDQGDANRLPVCYDGARELAQTFNKYGIGHRALLQATPEFSPSFGSLSWVEGEWLVHVLALLLAHHDESADPSESSAPRRRRA
jgi:hypothetical protein